MLTLTGKPIHGLGIAHETVVRQTPFLREDFPQIDALFPGTINLRLSEPLFISKPDIVTRAFDWSTDWKERLPPESFRLTRFHFSRNDSVERIEGWIYEPSLSVHRSNPFMMEFLAPHTPYEATDVFHLHFDRPRTEHRLWALG